MERGAVKVAGPGFVVSPSVCHESGPDLRVGPLLGGSINGQLLLRTGGVRPSALAYMDNCLVHFPTLDSRLEQHLLDIAKVLEIFRWCKLFAKSSKCEFRQQELGFLGHCLSRTGVLVNQR